MGSPYDKRLPRLVCSTARSATRWARTHARTECVRTERERHARDWLRRPCLRRVELRSVRSAKRRGQNREDGEARARARTRVTWSVAVETPLTASSELSQRSRLPALFLGAFAPQVAMVMAAVLPDGKGDFSAHVASRDATGKRRFVSAQNYRLAANWLARFVESNRASGLEIARQHLAPTPKCGRVSSYHVCAWGLVPFPLLLPCIRLPRDRCIVPFPFIKNQPTVRLDTDARE